MVQTADGCYCAAEIIIVSSWILCSCVLIRERFSFCSALACMMCDVGRF